MIQAKAQIPPSTILVAVHSTNRYINTFKDSYKMVKCENVSKIEIIDEKEALELEAKNKGKIKIDDNHQYIVIWHPDGSNRIFRGSYSDIFRG